MMWLVDAVAALSGAFAVAMGRDSAFEHFDLTAEGFWRSFAAVIVVAPLYVYADRVDALYPPQGEPVAFSFSLSLLTLAVEWIAWPVAVALLTFRTRFSALFARYITVYNWTSIPVFVVMVIPLVALDLGLIGLKAAVSAGVMLLMAALWYRWQVARLALEAPALVALGLVGGDIVLSLAISRLING